MRIENRADSFRSSRVRRRVLVIFAAALGTALVVFVLVSERNPPMEPGAATTMAPPTEPLGAAEAFLDAWAASDWTVVGALSTPDAVSALASWWRELGVEKADFSVDGVDERDGGATVAFTVTAELGGALMFEYPSVMELVPAGDVWQIQWLPGTAHPALAAGGHLELRQVPAPRAPVLAADGSPLVSAVADVVVGVIPGRVESRSEVRRSFAENTGLAPADVDALLDRSDLNADWFYPLVTVPAAAYPQVKPAMYPVPGVGFRVEPRRGPLEPSFASHLLGRTGEITAELLDEFGEGYAVGDVVGRSGLERAYERSLAGEPAVEVVRIAGDGGEPEVVASFPGEPPRPLRTTLSVDVQRAAERALAELDLPASLVVLDVATGEVRAAASRPADDFNRAFSALYPPGSTFKIIVAAALLEAGLTTETELPCPAVAEVGGREFRNSTKLPASLSLERAFALSCNTAFIQASVSELTPAILAGVAARFGFGEAYDPGLAAAGGSYPLPSSEAEAAAAAIGQGRVLASPLHMASVVAASVTGVWRSPVVVAGRAQSEVALGNVSTELMEVLLEAVISDGTGRAARVPDHVVAGKTGTAQVGGGEDAGVISWFVGVADGLAFAVAVEGGESGGVTAAPVAAALIRNLETGPGAQARCVEDVEDWPVFQGLPSRAGCSAAPSIVTPRIRWTAEVGIQAWLNGPVVVGDTVYVGTAGGLRTIPDARDGVVALDLATGAERWRFQAGNDVNGIAVAGDRLFATGDEGAVWALDLPTGEVLWRFEHDWPVFTNPLVAGDLIVVGDSVGTVHALSGEDGELVWSHGMGTAIRGGAATDGELIYAASESGAMSAFTLDGFELWTTTFAEIDRDLSGRVLAAPTVTGNTVTFTVVPEPELAQQTAVVALDRFVGTPVWIATDPQGIGGAMGAVRGSAALSVGDVVIAGSPSTGLTGIEATNGVQRWRSADWALCDTQVSTPIVVGDVVVAARLDGAVYAVEPATGETRWRVPLTIPGFSALIPECEPRDQLVRTSPIEATPAVAADGTLLVGSLAGFLYAIEETSPP